MNEKSKGIELCNSKELSQLSELEDIIRRFEAYNSSHYDLALRFENLCFKLNPIEEETPQKKENVYLNSIIGKLNECLDVYSNIVRKEERLIGHLDKLI